MSRNEVILAVAAGALVVFSLVVSLVVPRWWPDFPGRRTGLFTFVALLLVAGMLGAVELFGAEEGHGAEAVETGTETGEGTTTGETTTGETDTGETDTGETDTGETDTGGTDTGETDTGEDEPDDSDQIKQGEAVFAAQSCGSCHVMEKADASGTTGPNLDELQPSFDAVVSQVTNGGGGMPAYGGQLSDADIQAVAAYVVDSTSRR